MTESLSVARTKIAAVGRYEQVYQKYCPSPYIICEERDNDIVREASWECSAQETSCDLPLKIMDTVQKATADSESGDDSSCEIASTIVIQKEAKNSVSETDKHDPANNLRLEERKMNVEPCTLDQKWYFLYFSN